MGHPGLPLDLSRRWMAVAAVVPLLLFYRGCQEGIERACSNPEVRGLTPMVTEEGIKANWVWSWGFVVEAGEAILVEESFADSADSDGVSLDFSAGLPPAGSYFVAVLGRSTPTSQVRSSGTQVWPRPG